MFRRIKNFGVFILVLLTATLWLSACSVTPSYNDYGKEENNVQTFDMPNVVKCNISVDSLHSGKFSVPVIVDFDLNKFNSSVATTNDDIFVLGCEGTEINDLSISGQYVTCVTSENVKVDGHYKYYACIFDFSVTAKENWSKKNIVRQISKVKVKILEKEVDVPVNIAISECSIGAFVNECPIISNSKFLTLTNSNEDAKYFLAINWNTTGWGATEWTAPDYATITGFAFENNNFKLTNMKIIQPKYVDDEYQESEHEIDLNNTAFRLDTYDCAMSGSWLWFSVEKQDGVHTVCNFLTDSLIMEYTINGDEEVHRVCLASVQLNNYEAVLTGFYSDNG